MRIVEFPGISASPNHRDNKSAFRRTIGTECGEEKRLGDLERIQHAFAHVNLSPLGAAALTTTGFGDFTPATPVGHALAVIEMLVGQLYLVTVIGLLIGNFASRRRPV